MFSPIASVLGVSGVLLASAVGYAAAAPARSDSERRVVHTGEIRTDETWSADVVHVLASTVRVVDGAALTIEAGARVEAAFGTAIVVQRASRITAVGSEAVPIVLGCAESVPTQGCWLGVLLEGNAPVVGGTNTSPPVRGTGAAGCAELPSDGYHGAFGGCDPDDDSGELRYVRVEYASRGLELLGVGRGTRIDRIQVHDALSTAVRIRGGTVDITRFIASSFGGTAYAWSDGWQGRGQHLVAHRLQGNGSAAIDGANVGASGPTVSQVTVISDAAGPALRLRGAAPFALMNALIVGSASALDLDGVDACGAAAAGTIAVRGLALVGVGRWDDADADADCGALDAAEATALAQPLVELREAPITAVNAVLRSALTTFLPDLRPLGLGNALGMRGVRPPADGFFDQSDRIGGVELDFGLLNQFGIIPWYSGWTIEGAALPAPMGVVTGVARTAAGTPVGGVRIRVSTSDLSAVSGDDGGFSVGLSRPGVAVVSADVVPAGCTAAPVTVSVVAGSVVTADIVLTCGTVGFDPTGIRLTYICANLFRVTNPHPREVTVTWDVYGTSEGKVKVLAPAPAGGVFSALFETVATGTVRLFYEGVQIDVKANGGFACTH